MPVLFALVAFFGWGIGDIFGTIAARKIGGYSTTFWYLFIAFATETFYAIFVIDQLKNFTPQLFALTFLLGIVGAAGLITFYEGLRIGYVSLVGTISGSFAALTVILSLIFLGESITVFQGISILIIFAGVILSSLDFQQLLQKKEILASKGTFLALCTLILWGIYWAFIKIPVRQAGWFWPGYIAIAPMVLIPLFMKIKKIKIEKINAKGAFPALFLNAILLPFGAFSLNFAMTKSANSLVTPIAGSYPALFVALSFFIFHEKVNRQQLAGISITLLGIIVLSSTGI